MYDICLNKPDQGDGIESYVDVDTAVTNAIRLAWKLNDPKVSLSIRDETGVIQAVVITDVGDVAWVMLADGTVVGHPRGVIL